MVVAASSRPKTNRAQQLQTLPKRVEPLSIEFISGLTCAWAAANFKKNLCNWWRCKQAYHGNESNDLWKPPEGHKNQKDTKKAVFLTEISFKIQRLVVELSKEWVGKILIAKVLLIDNMIPVSKTTILACNYRSESIYIYKPKVK